MSKLRGHDGRRRRGARSADLPHADAPRRDPRGTALGYHLTNANFNSEDYAALPQDRLPDIVLVREAYPNCRKSKARSWRLRSIGKEAGEEDETGAGSWGA
ncbi:hypothetical protein C8R44DRAFT_876250 [Mycena epipterygia]|nr:hypothetical protein C8R44DRAFT_876250 [Mycena epipterygia]